MVQILSIFGLLLFTSGSCGSYLRDTAYQLYSGSVSIGGASKVRNERQVGRNSLGASNGYALTSQVATLHPVPMSAHRALPYQNYNIEQNRPLPNPRLRNTTIQNKVNVQTSGSHRNSPVDTGGASRYYYPPRMPLPLATCFHNPTGYVCCNKHLNDLIVDTYMELESRPKFHTCNINAIARELQLKAETRFNTTFETIASYEDFAQKIHFNGDLACKVEIGGKYMLAYGTVKDADIYLKGEDHFIGPKPARALHHISKRHSAFF